MPQFDLLTIGVQFWGLIFSLIVLYYIYIFCVIPYYTEIKKIRMKKEKSGSKALNTTHSNLIDNNEIKNYYYKVFFYSGSIA